MISRNISSEKECLVFPHCVTSIHMHWTFTLCFTEFCYVFTKKNSCNVENAKMYSQFFFGINWLASCYILRRLNQIHDFFKWKKNSRSSTLWIDFTELSMKTCKPIKIRSVHQRVRAAQWAENQSKFDPYLNACAFL